MHTLSMVQSIMQAALKEAENYDGNSIKAITVKIGDESFLESDWLQFCLEVEAMGTIAEGARIEIELVSANEPFQVALELD